eukprot:987902-Prymnesium_polylepis.1
MCCRNQAAAFVPNEISIPTRACPAKSCRSVWYRLALPTPDHCLHHSTLCIHGRSPTKAGRPQPAETSTSIAVSRIKGTTRAQRAAPVLLLSPTMSMCGLLWARIPTMRLMKGPHLWARIPTMRLMKGPHC